MHGHMNLKFVNVLLSEPTITVGPSLNLTKQRPVGCSVWPNELHHNRQ